MKIKLCGEGSLAADVVEYFTIGKEYEILCTEHGEAFDVRGDDGIIHSPAIFKDGSKCAYLEGSTGNLFWSIVE